MNNFYDTISRDVNKAILENESQIFELKKEEIINQKLKEKDKEIKRLNNIINELEKGINENIEELEEHQLSRDRIDEDKEILRFLQELKGSEKE